MNIFVGNLPYGATDTDLRKAFEAYGTVASASVIIDKFTGKSRGFGFIEMPDAAQGKAAIEGLNDQELHGRPIRVNEAKPREDRPPRREGGGFGGGGYGGRERGDRGDRDGGYSQRRSGGYGPRS
ncbi:MAG TPA: RNA-binding protein [Kiritimatiellia bacterium]|nr:RNA-binding protein [Kiritimatiellia bacterium]HMO98801.1 RNA-binding protein [Kiritimatiellia bacterium]HMP96866.1 RNA-binding protein [Kiritimatiellia bacterium]